MVPLFVLPVQIHEPPGLVVEVLEARRDAQQKEHQREPRRRVEAAVQVMADEIPDNRGNHEGDAHGAQSTEHTEELSVLFFHDVSQKM